MNYNFTQIEKKWQEKWDELKSFKTKNDYTLPKFYALVEFPYPSGAGLHVGHPRSYTALDIVARKKRLENYNVLYPMGWDAFGLPTENFAIKHKIHPSIVTQKNVARFKEQLKALGLSFDWDREINTTSTDYYKWTQWIFIEMFKRGLAYKATVPVNFCVSCKCVLANEEVIGGACERCSSEVIQKEKSQWMLKITEYADRLIDDLDEVDYPQRVKLAQTNWIGRSVGATINFKTSDDNAITIFTTRPETIFGATYMVISPEHPFIDSADISNKDEILAYREKALKKSELERTENVKNKDGIKLKNIYAINPVTNKHIPIYVSDYVLMGYGTGAIMAVPAHDTRDYEFAVKFGIDILTVIDVINGEQSVVRPYLEDGIMINSGFLNGLIPDDAKKIILKYIKDNNLGDKKINYKLRDWVFSRQRYWGEPIPLVYCKKCDWQPVENLPLTLPDIEDFEQTDDGNSPLAKLETWINTTCPVCGGAATRETDTMPQWAGSSWYFLRYIDPDNKDALASKEAIEYFLPIDWYNGGMEHTTLHLLYSRFWFKFLYDIGVVPYKEPYARRTSHGMILGETGEKMSKSRGNVINPDDIIKEYGADTMRLYEMFLGDFEKSAPWSPKSIIGCKRFLDKIWQLKPTDGDEYSKANEISIHKAIKKVSNDIETLKFNTAIATLMSLLNTFSENGINKAEYKTFLILINPFAPHITEELWCMNNFHDMLSNQKWPSYDEAKTADTISKIAVQINGKLKSVIEIEKETDDETAKNLALTDEKVLQAIKDKTVVKVIYIKGKIINIVIK